MNIKMPFFIALFIALGFLITMPVQNILIAHAQEDVIETEPEDLDIIIINNDVYEKDRKGPVVFAHREHAKDYKLICWDCHHEYEEEGGENIYSPWGTTMACAECHDPIEKQDNIVKLQTAYHLSCKKCHEEMKIYGDEPLAYRKCNRCHEKKESDLNP